MFKVLLETKTRLLHASWSFILYLIYKVRYLHFLPTSLPFFLRV